MPTADTPRDADIIADLNDLLQLDHDAVEAYTLAIDLARDAAYREQLVAFRADHKRHIEELGALVRARGGLPTELPHPTGGLKLTVQALGALGGDTPLLLAFKAVEGQARDKYGRFARKAFPQDALDVVKKAAADEEKHYAWVEQALADRGVGRGTLPHGIAQVVEGIHKLIADPAERAEREVMRAVGRVVGTTRSRGGSAAPSPADAATGAANRAADAADDLSRRAPGGSGAAPSGGLADRAARAASSAMDAMDRMGDALAGRRAGASAGTGGAQGHTAHAPGTGEFGINAVSPAPSDAESLPADEFIEALHALEEGRDVERMVQLFDDDCELTNPTQAAPHRGVEGVREFWRSYRDTFEEIHSDFSRVVETGDTTLLEWTSSGRARGGEPIRYSGVSILETRAGKVHRFRAYFDSGALGAQMKHD